MKITEIEEMVLRLPTVERECNGTQDAFLVRIRTDAGLTGIGEANSSPR